MYKDFIAPKIINQDQAIGQDENLPKAVICDLDGTLALLNRNPYDAANCDKDLLNEPVANIVKTFKEAGHLIILVSGRSDEFQPQTLTFLENNQIPYDKLHMRRANDRRKDSEVKMEIYEQQIKNKYFIDFVLDDRNQVVDMWRSLGFVCCQVAPGDF